MDCQPETDVEKLCRSGLLAYHYYSDIVGNLGWSPEDAAAHYLAIGAAQGLRPHPLFDTRYYVHTYAPPINPLLHYVTVGHLTANPIPLFDTAYYRSQLPPGSSDVIALAHFDRDGWREGRDPHPLFEVRTYLELSPDVASAGHNPLVHYLSNGSVEGRVTSDLFDPGYYRTTYRDVAALGIDPLTHYVEHGAREGRNPSATFDTAFYAAVAGLSSNGSVNPLSHYKLHGRAMGLPTHKPPLRLSASFTAPAVEWQAWLAARARPKPVTPPRTITELVFVLPDAAAVQAWKARLAAVAQRLAPVLPVSARPFATLGARRGKRAAVPPGALLILAAADDEPVPDELVAALGALPRSARLAVFDLFGPSSAESGGAESGGAESGDAEAGGAEPGGGEIRPVLMPGANRVQLQAIDACHSRFAILGSFLNDLAAAARPAWATPRALMLDALRALDGARRARGFVHLPHFVLHTPELDTEDGEIEAGLLARAVDLSGRAGAAKELGAGVSAVICSKDKGHLLSQLVDRLLALPPGLLREVVVVTNGPENRFARAHHARLGQQDRVRIVPYDKPYNFSSQSNLGARQASGELLLFINDDIIPIGDAWLQRLVGALDDPRVGIAGPLLLYPGETVQHAGMFLGFNNVAGHALRAATLPEGNPNHYALAPRQVSALTGAVFLVRRTLFEQLGGFDEQLGTFLQDVDFCMRASGTGADLVYEPRAMLFHCESVSTLPLLQDSAIARRRTAEHERFTRRWGDAIQRDPFHNPAYDPSSETLRVLR